MTAFARALIDSVTIYKKSLNKDTGGVAIDPDTKLDIGKCRIDRTAVYTIGNESAILKYDMTVFVYPKYANQVVIGQDYQNAFCVIDGQEMTIVSITENKNLYNGAVFSYEIGVKKAG